MRQHKDVRELAPRVVDIFDGELLVNFTAPMPADEFVLDLVVVFRGFDRENDMITRFSRDDFRKELIG